MVGITGQDDLFNFADALEEMEAQRQLFYLDAIISRFNSDIFINNVCLSYRHDFGLMVEQEKQRLRFECKEWMRAISNNLELFRK